MTPAHSGPGRTRMALALAWAAIIASACAPARVTTGPAPAAGGFHGFDTSRYPGDDALRAWRSPGSPYRWVGFYLQSPCRRDTSWNGKRPAIVSMGWGMAVLYVGEQAWESGSPPDTAAAAPTNCSRSLLSAARGTSDASDAIARAATEGFAPGTTIFLDIERMSAVPDSMREYYRAWVAGLWRDGRYRPGIYAHRTNVDVIRADIESERTSASPSATAPQWWITGGGDFSLERAPRDAGVAYANIWQGLLNVSERWNGVSLNIDVNVADRPSPSAP